MPPRGGNAGRAAATADGGLASAESGDPPGPQIDSPSTPGHTTTVTSMASPIHDCGCDGRAAPLHQLQQQLQSLWTQAVQQQAAHPQWPFNCYGGRPAPPPLLPQDVSSALANIEQRIMARLGPLESRLAALNVAPASQASASPPGEGRGRVGRVSFVSSPGAPVAPRHSASPTGSATGSDTTSLASTEEDLVSILDAILGVASDDLAHDFRKRGLSPAWSNVVKSTGSKILGDDIVNLSTLLIVGRTLRHLAWLVYQIHDDPSAVPRDQIEDVFPHITVVQDSLSTRLNQYQLLASGLDDKAASALADAAAFKRRVAQHGDGVLAGLPIACSHLTELVADYQKKTMDKDVKALHDPSPEKSGKPANLPGDDDIDSLRAQLEKSEARAKKLEVRLSESGRKSHGTWDSKDSDPERPPDPKKTDNPKSPARPVSTDAPASD
jgi:hypothetical protein